MSPQTALLVIDMQVFFRPMTTTCLPNVLQLLSHFSPSHTTSRSSSTTTTSSKVPPGPIIFTQHGHSAAELPHDASTSTNQLVRKWGIQQSIHEGSEDWKLMKELADWVPRDVKGMAAALEGGGIASRHGHGFDEGNPGHAGGGATRKRVKKNTYDAFINTNLIEILEQEKVERVVVCGVMTDCCCDTTARSAFNRGYETWLVSDACGSANKRQHDAGLNGFGFAFGEVLKTDEVIMRLGK